MKSTQDLPPVRILDKFPVPIQGRDLEDYWRENPDDLSALGLGITPDEFDLRRSLPPIPAEQVFRAYRDREGSPWCMIHSKGRKVLVEVPPKLAFLKGDRVFVSISDLAGTVEDELEGEDILVCLDRGNRTCVYKRADLVLHKE